MVFSQILVPFVGPSFFLRGLPPPAGVLGQGCLPGVPIMGGASWRNTMIKTGIQYFFAIVFGEILGPFLEP